MVAAIRGNAVVGPVSFLAMLLVSGFALGTFEFAVGLASRRVVLDRQRIQVGSEVVTRAQVISVRVVPGRPYSSRALAWIELNCRGRKSIEVIALPAGEIRQQSMALLESSYSAAVAPEFDDHR
jgi:hypothetical protein